MHPPLAVRLLLDAESEIVRAADATPRETRDARGHGLNAPGWTVAHAAFFLDVWLSVDAQGRELGTCDPWLLDWFRRQQAAGAAAIETSFAEARRALGRAIDRTNPLVANLTDAALEEIPARIAENGWPEGTTVGYLVARSIAHLFAHASELNVACVAAGGPDMGLPGRLAHTLGAPPS